MDKREFGCFYAPKAFRRFRQRDLFYCMGGRKQKESHQVKI